jgi:hypothetical protein
MRQTRVTYTNLIRRLDLLQTTAYSIGSGIEVTLF